ncbi:unnamed protein product [Discula destructiva]
MSPIPTTLSTSSPSTSSTQHTDLLTRLPSGPPHSADQSDQLQLSKSVHPVTVSAVILAGLLLLILTTGISYIFARLHQHHHYQAVPELFPTSPADKDRMEELCDGNGFDTEAPQCAVARVVSVYRRSRGMAFIIDTQGGSSSGKHGPCTSAGSIEKGER